MCWSDIFVSLTQTRIIWDEGTSTEKKPMGHFPDRLLIPEHWAVPPLGT